MKLSSLAASMGDRVVVDASEDPDITSLYYRAQDVRPGGLFVAVSGLSADGHDFIDAAIERGAAAVVIEKNLRPAIPFVRVTCSRTALARMAARFCGDPSKDLFLVGVTGTNGKTTTSYLIEGIFKGAGFQTGVIGTVNYRYGDVCRESAVTTPESLDLQRILAEMAAAGVTHVVMEVSSHGVDLARIEGCHFDVGVFTNLSRDHLDYHGDMARYWACKRRFFTRYLAGSSKNAVAVVNCVSEKGRELAHDLTIPVVAVGSEPACEVRPGDARFDLSGISGHLQIRDRMTPFASFLVGKHNLENILCAAGVGAALGLSPSVIGVGIGKTLRVPGRLEPVPNDTDRYVFVDYAHTPDALEKTLETIRSLTDRRVITVFGAGGNRDRGKRPKMGEVAGRLSDFVVVTSDNPRMEPPASIVEEVAAGLRPLRWFYDAKALQKGFPGPGFATEVDREKGIRLALSLAEKQDAVLIAGKGHETYQVMGPVTVPFDDRKAVSKAISFWSDPSHEPPFWTPSRVAEATGGTVLSDPAATSAFQVGIDSRNLPPGAVFVAIKGERHDGHDFVDEVVGKGARMVVVQKDRLARLSLEKCRSGAVGVVAVPDSTRALGDMAAFLRGRRAVSVVAVTGSNGKTSTRGMCAAVAAAKGPILATAGNLNNHIGLPLTLLGLRPGHQWAVLEMGMNHPGEIRRLSEISRPDVALITNIGPAHLEGVGSLEGVAAAKAEVIDFLHPKGALVLNADCPHSMGLKKRLARPVLLFGTTPEAHVRAEDIVETAEGVDFTLSCPAGSLAVHLAVPGRFMASNALAAAAVGFLMGIELEEIGQGLASFTTAPGRMRILHSPKGFHIVDDTYNANPMSMKAALDTAKTLAGGRRVHFVSGDMLELGEESAALHAEIGRYAAEKGINWIYAAGSFAQDLAKGSLAAGFRENRIRTGTREEVAQLLLEEVRSGDWVLIKGSRGMAMEKVVSALMDA